tara:strand:- start:422 stop:964 length:543 start_codon:yes stop_codon:yes gene_type:complete
MVIKILSFFIIFFTAELFSVKTVEVLFIEQNTQNESKENNFSNESILLKNSFVILDKDDVYKDPSLKSLGPYKYILEVKETQKANISNLSEEKTIPLKLIKFPNSEYRVTDGSVIVAFKEGVDKETFASDFGLESKSDFGFGVAYKAISFESVEKVLSEIKNDSRVKYAEYDYFQTDIPH